MRSLRLEEFPLFHVFVISDINVLGGVQKKRRLHAPNDAMRMVHQTFIGYLRGLGIWCPSATGAVRRGSPARNVAFHRRNRYLYTLDLKGAYQQVDAHKLAAILCREDPKLAKHDHDKVVAFLERYCMASSPETGLATGAPASPDLFNIYAEVLLDRALRELCVQYNLCYTRYLDDITLSSQKGPIGDRKRKAIKKTIRECGFVINENKTHLWDLQKGPAVINGVGLKLGGRMYVPAHYISKMRGILHLALHNPDKAPSAETINGMMGVITDILTVSGLPKSKTEQKLFSYYYAWRQTTKGCQ
ncbi:MAG: reverse transcriptase domain-containing protein [Candidatus Paceibacterota bacterium]